MDSPNFDCPVCLDIINEPISLPCGHNFCSDCHQELSSHCKGKCPVCRRQFPSRSYQINSLIKYFVQFEHFPSILKYSAPSGTKKNHRIKSIVRCTGCILIIAAILLLVSYKARSIKKWPNTAYQICTRFVKFWAFVPALGNISELCRYVLSRFVSISPVSNL